ncbi:MAG: hypothetical protein IPH65_17540 [Dehalococcoidia bacterium]|uniref:hypothetical protein n=1 Tax=Candidatus Amarobacter glycogenicus TaxID=3140699 RepID=UPI003134EE19|nr:hypothetical protein [Dehalococcoidia bacterium]
MPIHMSRWRSSAQKMKSARVSWKLMWERLLAIQVRRHFGENVAPGEFHPLDVEGVKASSAKRVFPRTRAS